MTDELWRLSAAQTAEAIRTRKVTCAEVTEAHVARMAEVNAQVNAVTVDLSREALAEARRADADIKAGKLLGPLHGVPVTIKENVDQAGQATTNGVAAFLHAVANEDSPVVANLRKAGAIVIGRTNTPEFSLRWFTDNPLRGRTVNPWDLQRTPGGSSGGAAAATAVGIGTIGHGNDLGGSLRYPAYCCGLATIRPSFGRVPAFNATAPQERPPTMQLMSVQGPIAREINDVRVALAAMSRGDSRDPWWVPAPLEGPPVASQPIRVAFCPDPCGDGVDAAVAESVRKAAACLDAAGYAVEEITPPMVSEIAAEWGLLLFTEIRHMLEPLIRQHGSKDVIRVLEWSEKAYPRVDLDGYMRAKAERTRRARMWSAFLEKFPLVVVPVSGELPMAVNDDTTSLERMREIVRAQRMLVAVNYLGLPAVAVPTGLAGGMPCGVQVIGSWYREGLCLDAAEVIQRATGILSEQLWMRNQPGG